MKQLTKLCQILSSKISISRHISCSGFVRATNADVAQWCQNLKLNTDCTVEDVKFAYIQMAKLHHPDSGHPGADSAKFAQIEDSYKKLMVGVIFLSCQRRSPVSSIMVSFSIQISCFINKFSCILSLIY